MMKDAGLAAHLALTKQMAELGRQMKPRATKRLRGRPRKQEHVAAIFRDRLRANLTEQVWMRERNQIARSWSASEPPDDRTIRRAVAGYYGKLRWLNGKVTPDSAALVLAEMAGQK